MQGYPPIVKMQLTMQAGLLDSLLR